MTCVDLGPRLWPSRGIQWKVICHKSSGSHTDVAGPSYMWTEEPTTLFVAVGTTGTDPPGPKLVLSHKWLLPVPVNSL